VSAVLSMKSGRNQDLYLLPQQLSRLYTVEPGDVVGWTWLFPPYRWKFDLRAVEEVHAISFDGECQNAKAIRSWVSNS